MDHNIHLNNLTPYLYEAIGDGEKKSKEVRRMDVAISKLDRTQEKMYGKQKPSEDGRSARGRIRSAAWRLKQGHDPEKMKAERDDVFQTTKDVRHAQKLVAIRNAQKSIRKKKPSENHPNLRPQGVNEETFDKVMTHGEKLGDHLGKSYYHHDNNIYMLHGGKAVNHGPKEEAARRFNKQLRKNLNI